MRDEIMKSLGYRKVSTVHRIETFENGHGDKIMIDLVKREVTKTSSNNVGWLKENELQAVSRLIERV